MSEHHGAVFNNSCLKVPVNPSDRRPYPVYDQKLVHQLENQARKLSIDSRTSEKRSSKDSLKSFIEFYDSIPEYDDVNHLSNRDFYRKLENLKERQRSFFDYLRNEIRFENRNTVWVEDYKNLGVEKVLKSNIKALGFNEAKNEDVDSVVSEEKEVVGKPPSRRSVRIESPTEKYSHENTPDFEYFRSKSRADLSSAGSKRNKTFSPLNDSIFDDFSDLDVDRETFTTKSAPGSPRKGGSVGWKDCGITIPKPFQMTVRDEENKIVDELLIKKKPMEEKPEMFRANPVPIESQIPLFEKIMYDQELRRQVVKRKSKDNLRSQMRPFSFTRREEEIQAITKRLSKSSPSLFMYDERPKVKRFKAKPVPKNLFSNYIYRKMHEDEFYRALQKKIRAEEMLKAASLPPAMAKRERTRPKQHVCPRSYRDMQVSCDGDLSRTKAAYSSLERELAELELDYILATPSPKPVKGKGKKKGRKGQRKSSAESKGSLRCNSALESVNRSNLASVLRIETARKRMEDEITMRLEQARIKEESRWREKVLRKRPVWQALAYSHEEDLNMRLQLRRDEERLRREEHKCRMQSMLGRVNLQPTLFERQSQARLAKTREELIAKLYKNAGRYQTTSKPSSSDTSEGRSVVEMKDEAIQAQFDEIFREEVKAAMAGDDVDEDTEETDDKN